VAVTVGSWATLHWVNQGRVRCNLPEQQSCSFGSVGFILSAASDRKCPGRGDLLLGVNNPFHSEPKLPSLDVGLTAYHPGCDTRLRRQLRPSVNLLPFPHQEEYRTQ
jgi:hypothetical protein